MEPNINQPLETNPVQQPVPQPVPPTETTPVAPAPAQPAPVASEPVTEVPKKSGKKWLILLLLLFLLVVGIVVYALFAKNQMNNMQKTNTEDSSLVLPTATAIPTLAPEEDLEIGTPEADLLELDADVKDL